MVRPKGKTSVAEGPKVEGGRVRGRDGDHGVWEPSSARGVGGGERRGRELVLSCWRKNNQERRRVKKVTLTRRAGLKETAQLSWCRKSN